LTIGSRQTVEEVHVHDLGDRPQARHRGTDGGAQQAASAIGESITRSAPKRSNRPRVAP